MNLEPNEIPFHVVSVSSMIIRELGSYPVIQLSISLLITDTNLIRLHNHIIPAITGFGAIVTVLSADLLVFSSNLEQSPRTLTISFFAYEKPIYLSCLNFLSKLLFDTDFYSSFNNFQIPLEITT